MNTYKTAQQQAVTGTQQLNTATTTTMSTMDRLKGSFSTLTLGVTTLTTGVFNLYNTYDNLNDTQLKLETMQQKLDRSNKTLSEAQEKYNKLLKDGKASSDDIADALRDVNLAQDKVTLSSAKLADAQEDLDRAWKDFYINTIPAAVQTLGGGAAAIGTFAGAMRGVKPAADAAKSGISGLGPAAVNAGAGMTTVAAGGSRLIPILGGIGAAIAVVGGTLLAVNQNFGGFRDMMNNVGVAIGDAVPQLEGVLNVIKGFAGQIGISGEAVDEWQKALSTGLETLGGQFETWSGRVVTVLDNVETILNEIGFAAEAWIANVQKVIGVYQDMADSVSKFVSDVKTGWDNLVLGAQNLGTQIKTAIDSGLAFLTNPETYTTAFSGLLDAAVEAGKNSIAILTSIINGIGKFVFGNDVWNNLVLGAQSGAQSAVKVIQDTLSGVKSWIETNIMPTINKIAKPVADALGSAGAAVAQGAADLTKQPTSDTYEAYRAKTREYELNRAINTTPYKNLPTVAVSKTPQTSGYTEALGPPKPMVSPQSTNIVPVRNPAVYGPPAGSNQNFGQFQQVFGQVAASTEKATAAQKEYNQTVGFGTTVVAPFKNLMAALSGDVDKNKVATASLGVSMGATASATGQLTQAQSDMITGYNEQNAVLDKSVSTLNKTKGELVALKEQLSEGGIQAVAFAQGFQDAEKNFLNMQVSTSKLNGEIEFLSQNLGTTEGIMVRFASGFATGAKSILDWAGSFDTMKGVVAGSKVALMDVAKTMGVEIPAGFQGGVEAIKEFISYSKAAGPEFEALMNTIQGAADKTIGGLGEALRRGNDEFKDEIDKLEEEWGFEFNDALTNALEGEAGPAAIESLVNSLSEAIKTVGPAIADPGVWDNIKEGFTEQIEETFDDFKENGGKNAEEAIQAIIDKLNAPIDLNDPLAIDKRIGEVQAAIVALKNQGSSTIPQVAEDMNTLNELNFDDAIEQLDKLKNALQTVGSGGNAKAGPAAKAEVGVDLGQGTTTSKQQGKEKGKTTKKDNPAGGVMAIDIAAFQSNLDEAATAFTDFMTTLFENAASIPAGVMAGITPLAEQIGATWLAIREGTTVAISMIVQEAQALGPGIAAGFEAAQEPAGAAWLAMLDGTKATISTIIQEAQALGPGIAAGFAAGRDQSQPHISGLAEDFASNAVVPIETMAEGIAETIGKAFEDGASRAKSALGEIEEAANQAASAVDAIASSINSIPDHKTVEIEVQVTGDSIPNQLTATGFSGIVGGKPGGTTMTVGEAGPEAVFVMPLTRAFTGPGSPRGGGSPGMNPHIFAAEGFAGILGGEGTADFATYRHGNLAGQAPQTVTISDVNIAMVGGRPVSSVGGVLGGIPVSIVSGNSGFVTGGGITGGVGGLPSTGGNGSGGGGGGSSGGGAGGGSNIQRQIDVMENGQRLFYYQNGADIRTNMNAEQISRYVGSGAGPGSGSGSGGGAGGGSGGGGGGGGGGTPTDWSHVQTTGGSKWTTSPSGELSVVPMTDSSHQGQFKIVDSTGKNVAANFTSEAEAEQYLDEVINGNAPPSGGGGSGGSGGGSGGSGGSGGGTTYQRRPPTGPGGVFGTRATMYGTADIGISSGANLRKGTPGISMDNMVHTRGIPDQPQGWAFTVANWNALPDEDRIFMVEEVGLFSIPEGAWLNEDYTIEEKHFQRPLNSPAGPDQYDPYFQTGYPVNGTGGGSSGGGTTNPPPSGGGGTGGPIDGGTDPTDNSQFPPGSDWNFDNVQVSGGSKWASTSERGDPDTWRIVKMTDDPSKWKIVNKDGKNIAAGFTSEQQAQNWIENYKNGGTPPPGSNTGGGGTPTTPPPSGGGSGGGDGGTGGNTGGNTGGGSTGGGGGGGVGSVPAGVKTSGSGSKWQGDIGTPDDWEVVPMVDADKKGLWKVINSTNGRNIATEFQSKEEAEEWLFAQQDGPNLPPGGNTGGNNGGTGGTPPGTGGTPGTGGGGGGGGQNQEVSIRVQENGQTLFYERDRNGAVRTNMTAAQIAQYVGSGAPGPSTGGGGGGGGQGTGGSGAGPNIGGIQFEPGFPFGPDTPIGPGGGPIIGGIEFPKGFPFHNTPGAFPGQGTGGPSGLLAGMGLPYSMISPRVTTDTSIPTQFSGFSGSGYVGNEPGAGGAGRSRTIAGGVGVPFGWPFGTGGNPNQGTNTVSANGITQTQSWSQSSNIVDANGISNRGNNYNYQYQSNTGNNVGGINFPPGFPFPNTPGGGGVGGGGLGGAQYYDSTVVENAEGTERHPEFRTNMNQAQMVRLLAMMEASGQEVPLYTSGEPALTGFRYNAAGWTGSRPVATARQLRTGRDNHIPIWDTGRVTMPSDFGSRGFGGVSGNIGGGSPFPGGGLNIGELLSHLKDSILSALQAALAKVAININLNNSSISDASTRLMMRRITGQF